MLPLTDNLRCKLFPLATLLIIALNCIAFVLELIAMANGNGEWFTNTFCDIPGNMTAAFHSGDPALIAASVMTLFTAMFLHGGFAHIFGNMLFLFVFGRAMEARLGSWKFVLFYIVSGLAASLLDYGINPLSMVPHLGASGAIAGVLGGYLALWPKAEITGLMTIIPVRTRAYWFLLFWLVMQVMPVIQNPIQSGGGVAYWAHIGGFLFGLLIAFVIRYVQPVSDVCYIPSDCEPCEEHDHEEHEHDGHVKDDKKQTPVV
jgi:membrane associated rhomboid family serine protease